MVVLIIKYMEKSEVLCFIIGKAELEYSGEGTGSTEGQTLRLAGFVPASKGSDWW
jgi:hypothetical protein